MTDGLVLEGTGGGGVVRRCCVNSQCQGIPLIWIIVGQGPITLAVGAGRRCLDIQFSLIYLFFLPLWETARYRLKYCLKGPLNPKQPTNIEGTTSQQSVYLKILYPAILKSIQDKRTCTLDSFQFFEITPFIEHIEFHYSW